MSKPIAHAAVTALIALAALAGAGSGRAADAAPSSLLALFERVPDLPATAQAAATWVDKRGALVNPALRSLADDIEAHLQAVALIARSRDGQTQARAAAQVEDLAKGMADVGIDMQRAQRDPAYAQQVQERMRRMSPQELMAMSQKMSQPMVSDKRLGNEARAMVEDPPAVRAAAEAGFEYSSAQLARMSAHQTIWREADEAVDRINAKPLKVAARKPTMEWDNIGCDNGCRAQWDVYASQMLPLMLARETEILQVRRAALQRQRAAVAAGLKAAEQHLQASRFGAVSNSQVNLQRIVGYDGAAIGELQQLMTRISDSVKRAAIVPHCGKQLVLVPGAVCS